MDRKSPPAPRTIVVTGATRGLGRALVERYLEEGHRVLACGRSQEHVDALCRLAPPERLLARSVDVTRDDAVRAFAEEGTALGFEPDLVIANAGRINDPAPLWEVPAEEFDGVLAVSASGSANAVRAFVPGMIRRGSGVVACLSSGWGRFGAADVAPYCAAKFAVEGLVSALSHDLPLGLAAVAVGPGVVDTDMLRQVRGAGVASRETPAAWAVRAAPFFLGLGPDDNGASISVPS
jgi:NAD(P)-dependent dehydrogenase (short-subunit alcohol dehydrogenase family)